MRRLLAALLALLIAVPCAYAQERKAFGQAELDQILAPVALYPDALLSQVLMASTYPLEVVEAARWSRAHPGIQGDEAVRAVADKDWDPSVKSLLAFPNLITRLDEKLDWTRRLGDAFLAQEAQVMDTVQQLRQRAQAAGKLQSDERQRVDNDGSNIVIEQANPRVVYVPYYDPYVVYGSWWWPAYPPVVWGPWPGYAVGYPGYWWGVGVGVTAGFFFGSIYWPHYHVAVAYPNVYYARPVAAHVRPYGPPPKSMQPGKWQHDTWHRHGVGERYDTRRAQHAMPPAGFRASGDHRGYEGRPEHRTDPRKASDRGMEARPDRRIEAPRTQQRADAPRQQPRAETPNQARIEAPRQQPRAETPNQARIEAPRQQPRAEVSRAQARPEAPRGQPGFEPRMESRGGEFRGWSGGGESRGGAESRGSSGGGGFRPQAPAQGGRAFGHGRS